MSAFGRARRKERRRVRRILARVNLRAVSIHQGDAPQAYHPMAELQRLGVRHSDRFTTLLGFPRFYDRAERIVDRREHLGYNVSYVPEQAPRARATRTNAARRLETYRDAKGFQRQRWVHN